MFARYYDGLSDLIVARRSRARSRIREVVKLEGKTAIVVEQLSPGFPFRHAIMEIKAVPRVRLGREYYHF